MFIGPVSGVPRRGVRRFAMEEYTRVLVTIANLCIAGYAALWDLSRGPLFYPYALGVWLSRCLALLSDDSKAEQRDDCASKTQFKPLAVELHNNLFFQLSVHIHEYVCLYSDDITPCM